MAWGSLQKAELRDGIIGINRILGPFIGFIAMSFLTPWWWGWAIKQKPGSFNEPDGWENCDVAWKE
ncbi:hypothetical protein E5D57_010201 [Metarhizium anisopliae]|nr:hypothetical protein E5D57_010201 [Metarhizium anisopliae]